LFIYLYKTIYQYIIAPFSIVLSVFGCAQRLAAWRQAGLSLHLIRGTKLENLHRLSDEVLPRLRQTAR